ncbi:hypothetical protein PB2503_08099 [Parvularcula bermudensis HTCC2503]|uniref:Phage major tail protein, TP901-1 family n=1 Tax=Parvularcula bermudensis (strain ATCC BAA-594 / HTCC2503 / KCTC 12087) TaxID=314260 RepID=E0THR8_PARBH|nr:phage major tail protein, TP901-1 family [Parvularcula bermudensis]ADM09675.1 hypothetical protein PB2503_08099 [Parvularcula bermudensis HTCC2503]
MTPVPGKDILIEISDGQGGFEILGGMRAKTFSLSTDTVDVTHAESAGWRALMPEAGIRRMSVSGNGLFIDDQAAARAQNSLLSAQVDEMRLSLPSFGHFVGPFMVTTIDYSGTYKGEATVSLSFASAGEVQFTGSA